MSITGSCLCGAVKFSVDRIRGPSEICHCVRCQKKSGSSSLEAIYVDAEAYHIEAGAELIQRFSAPILNQPPAYTSDFCRRCGSPVPRTKSTGEVLEIPSGLFDEDPGVQPDKHIFVDFMPTWNVIRDALPRLNLRELIKQRSKTELPADLEVSDHRGRRKKV